MKNARKIVFLFAAVSFIIAQLAGSEPMKLGMIGSMIILIGWDVLSR